MDVRLVLFFVIVPMSVVSVALGVIGIVRGLKRWGWGWRGRRTVGVWGNSISILVGLVMLRVFGGAFTVWHLILACAVGGVLVLITYPLIVRLDERFGGGRGPADT